MAHQYIDTHYTIGKRDPHQDYSEQLFPFSISLPGGWIVTLWEDGTWTGDGSKASFNNLRVFAGEQNITDAIVIWLLARELNRSKNGEVNVKG